MANAARFGAALERYGRRVRQGTERATHEFSVALYRRLQENTVRLTGFAQAGWNYSTGAADFSVEGERDLSRTYAARLPIQSAGFSLGQEIHLANGVDYIGLLDSGVLSKRAPLGITRPTLAETDGLWDRLLERHVPR